MRNPVVTIFRIGVVALLLLAFFSSVGAAAQPDPAGPKGGFLSRILAQLDLTSSEQNSIDTILATQKTIFQGHVTQLKSDRATLKTVSTLSSTYSQIAVQAAANAVGTDLANLIATRLQTEDLIYQALVSNPTQQAEFVKLLAAAKPGHGRFGH